MKKHILPAIILFLLLLAAAALLIGYLRAETEVIDPFVRVQESEVRIPNDTEDIFVSLDEGVGHYIVPETGVVGHVLIGDAHDSWSGEEHEDLLVVFDVNEDGSRTNTFLVVIDVESGDFTQVSGVFVGSRIEVESVEVVTDTDSEDSDYEVLVKTLVRPAGASFSQRPSVEVERVFSVKDQEIKEIK
ncbi:MAG: hypothetical protein O2794_00500 [bacterium]|nr:hypothetical protein [bacterium]